MKLLFLFRLFFSLEFDNHQRPVPSNNTLSVNKRVLNEVETVVYWFEYAGIPPLISDYSFRRNKIEGVELARGFEHYKLESGVLLEAKIVNLIEIEYGLTKFNMEDVERDMKKLDQFYLEFANLGGELGGGPPPPAFQ